MNELPKVVLALGLLAGFLWSARLALAYLWDGRGSPFALTGAGVMAAIAVWLFFHLRQTLSELKRAGETKPPQPQDER